MLVPAVTDVAPSHHRTATLCNPLVRYLSLPPTTLLHVALVDPNRLVAPPPAAVVFL